MQPAENVGGQWGIKKTKPDILFPKQKGGKSMDKNGQNLSGSKTKNLSVYDDGNIPEVDLPLPDLPTIDRNSPFSTERLTPSRAFTTVFPSG